MGNSWLWHAEPDAHDTEARIEAHEVDTDPHGDRAYTDAELAALVDSAPGLLDTLNELAAALGDDPNFATTVMDAIAGRLTQAQADLLYAALGHGHAQLHDEAHTDSDHTDGPNAKAAWTQRVLPFKSGLYYTTTGVVSSTRSMTAGRAWYLPFAVPYTASFDRIGIELATALADTVVRLGIYAAAADGQPGALVLDAGTVDTSAGPGDKSIVIAQQLSAGVYWLTAVRQGAGVGTLTLRAHTHFAILSPGSNSITSLAQGNATGLVTSDTNPVPGALPATAVAGSNAGSTPAVCLRAA